MKRIAVFLLFVPLVQAQTTDGNPPVPQSLGDWQRMIPAVRETLKAQFPDEQIEGQYPVGVFRVSDITGDGVSEALVSFGIGGASTSQLTLMRMEDGKAVVALFKHRDGKVSPGDFLEGASVMHTDTVEMLPKEHALYSVHYNFSGLNPDGVQKVHECGGEAYQWNRQTKIFDFSPSLSKRLSQDYCRKVRESWR